MFDRWPMGRRRLVAITAVVALLGGQYLWFRLNPAIWMGPQDGPPLLRVGVESDHPPFSSRGVDGTAIGFEPDIARALCVRMEMRCEFIFQPWTSMLADLLRGRYDIAVSSTPISAKLGPHLAFTDKYYSLAAMAAGEASGAASMPSVSGEARWRFLAPRGRDMDFSRGGMAGKRIGILRWGNFGELLSDTYPDALLLAYDSLKDAVGDLEAGKLDMVLGEETGLSKVLGESGEGQDLQLTGPTIDGPAMLAVDAGIAARRESGGLVSRLNQALRAIRADGTYRKLSDKYFPFDIFGG